MISAPPLLKFLSTLFVIICIVKIDDYGRIFSNFFPKIDWFVFEDWSDGDDLASAASARSIEMLAISCVCCCICSRLSIIRGTFANVKLEISDFSFAFKQRPQRFARLKDESKMLFTRGVSLPISAWIES